MLEMCFKFSSVSVSISVRFKIYRMFENVLRTATTMQETVSHISAIISGFSEISESSGMLTFLQNYLCIFLWLRLLASNDSSKNESNSFIYAHSEWVIHFRNNIFCSSWFEFLHLVVKKKAENTKYWFLTRLTLMNSKKIKWKKKLRFLVNNIRKQKAKAWTDIWSRVLFRLVSLQVCTCDLIKQSEEHLILSFLTKSLLSWISLHLFT